MEKKGNIITQIIDEYKKVKWADKKTVFQVTIIVLLITIFVALYVSIFDIFFGRALDGISNILTNFLK